MVILIIALGVLAVYFKSVVDYQLAVKKITIQKVDISTLADGIYTGEYNVNFIYAKVKVIVQDGKCTGIEIVEHKNERGKPAEIVADKIVDEQTIDVENIAGATNSSKVIKKAVENAFSN